MFVSTSRFNLSISIVLDILHFLCNYFQNFRVCVISRVVLKHWRSSSCLPFAKLASNVIMYDSITDEFIPTMIGFSSLAFLIGACTWRWKPSVDFVSAVYITILSLATTSPLHRSNLFAWCDTTTLVQAISNSIRRNVRIQRRVNTPRAWISWQQKNYIQYPSHPLRSIINGLTRRSLVCCKGTIYVIFTGQIAEVLTHRCCWHGLLFVTILQRKGQWH